MTTGFLQPEEQSRLIAECKDFGMEYDPGNPTCQIFAMITKKTEYPAFKIWALKRPADDTYLELYRRSDALSISNLSPKELKSAYLVFNRVCCLDTYAEYSDRDFTFATLHTPVMNQLNATLPSGEFADWWYDYDESGNEVTHYGTLKDVLQCAAKYGVDTTEFERFVADVYPQALTPARKTVVVNLFAGPGAGKTTCAWEIASELKKRGIEAEYVSEYAKEFVWDGKTDILDGSLEHQKMLFTEQAHRINRLLGKVDVVVTDSPTILGLLYLKEPNSDFEAQVLRDFNGHKNFNLFINRGQVFQQAGRIHNAAESIAIDKHVQEFLQANQIYYGTYYHSTVGVLVNNIIKNLANVNQKSQKRSTDCPAI